MTTTKDAQRMSSIVKKKKKNLGDLFLLVCFVKFIIIPKTNAANKVRIPTGIVSSFHVFYEKVWRNGYLL